MMQPFGRPQQVSGQNDPFILQSNAMYNAPQRGGGLGMQPGAPMGNNVMQQLGAQQEGMRQNLSPSHSPETSRNSRKFAMMEEFFERIRDEESSALSDREHDDLMNAWLKSVETPSPPVRPETDARPHSPPVQPTANAHSPSSPVRPETDARLPPTPAPVKSEVVESPHTVPAELPGTNEREPALATTNEASGPFSPVQSMPTSSPEANDAAQTSPP